MYILHELDWVYVSVYFKGSIFKGKVSNLSQSYEMQRKRDPTHFVSSYSLAPISDTAAAARNQCDQKKFAKCL